MIDFKLDTTKFDAWVRKADVGVMMMTETLKEISAIIEVHTRKFVPLDEGYLVGSMEERPLSGYPLVQMEQIWSGEENPTTDFDYAKYQEVTYLNHPKRGYTGVSDFMNKGIKSAMPNVMIELEKDYLTALGVK